MGRGGEAGSEGRSQDYKSNSKSIKKKMYHQKRRGQGYGGGRGRGGSREGGGSGGGSWHKKLFENMTGFLCTCNMNESSCTKEAFNLLNEYVRDEDIIKNATSTDTASDGVTDSSGIGTVAAGDTSEVKEDEEDIEVALKAEIKELKSETVRSKFISVDTGVPNLVFIKSTVKDPASLAHRILEDITKKKEHKSRFLLRLIPIELTCKANMEQIEGVCRRIFPKYFSANFVSFQILYKSRYNGNINRDSVIKLLADIVCEINPLNVVDLTNPKYFIIVEIVKSIVCISVVTDFNKFKKYNLYEAASDENEKKPEVAKDGEGDEGVHVPVAKGSNNAETAAEPMEAVEDTVVPAVVPDDSH